MRKINVYKTKFAALLIVALCASLAVPVFASAQAVEPTTSQYSDQVSQVTPPADGGPSSTSGTPSGTPSGTASTSGLNANVGPLPFTGFDVIAMAAVALAVTGLGLGLQRAVSRESTDQL